MTAKFVQHRSPQTNKAKAPYNFVPLPEKVLTIEGDEKKRIEEGLNDKYHLDRHTGYIDLEITTETPLYTRCATPAEVWSKYHGNEYFENDKPKVTAIRECQDFFHQGDANIPVIPGSTLRGMTRSLVEILAYGKMNFVTTKLLVYRSVAQPFYRENFSKERNGALDYPVSNLKAGYLEMINGEYYIRPAVTDSDGNYFVRVEYSEFVKVEPKWQEHRVYDGFHIEPPIRKLERMSSNKKVRLRFAITKRIEKKQFNGSKKVSVVCSGDMTGQTKKHMHYAIYEPNNSIPQNQLIKIDRDLWQTYQEDLEMSRGIEPREIKVGKSLFYLMDNNGLIFFGPTMMFRLPYKNSIQKFVPEIIRCDTEIDLVEAMFGTVGEKIISGRVFFSDASCHSTEHPFYDNDKEGRFVPKILASPKPTSFQLYLCQSGQRLKTYNESGQTVVRGSKRYWHKKEIDFEEKAKAIDYDSQKNTYTIDGTQHTIIRPVKPQTKFVGRVYFESLNDVELGALLTALELPESKRHQIGMAKPYGLGTVKIEIKNFVLQDRKKRYKSLFDDKGFWSNPTKELSEDCKQIFESKILETYNSIAEEKVSTFHQIPRLKELFSMLEWENAGHFDQKIYANLEDDKPMWRGRYVLPYPSSIESIENIVVASSDAQSSIQSNRTIQEQQEAITRSFQHYERAIESLSEGNKELKEIAKAILKKFKDKKDLGRSLAKQLLEKIGANGLDIELIIAKEEAHKDWYLKIKQMAK